PNTATTWTDTDVESGAEYEYRINRSEATGYIQTGIRLPLKDQMGQGHLPDRRHHGHSIGGGIE
ncbi:MAG: hypothetical protein PHF70_01260, partial [Opitutales bacterium]|nr:hypothetical protein [Opitutales bacterium]